MKRSPNTETPHEVAKRWFVSEQEKKKQNRVVVTVMKSKKCGAAKKGPEITSAHRPPCSAAPPKSAKKNRKQVEDAKIPSSKARRPRNTALHKNEEHLKVVNEAKQWFENELKKSEKLNAKRQRKVEKAVKQQKNTDKAAQRQRTTEKTAKQHQKTEKAAKPQQKTDGAAKQQRMPKTAADLQQEVPLVQLETLRHRYKSSNNKNKSPAETQAPTRDGGRKQLAVGSKNKAVHRGKHFSKDWNKKCTLWGTGLVIFLAILTMVFGPQLPTFLTKKSTKITSTYMRPCFRDYPERALPQKEVGDGVDALLVMLPRDELGDPAEPLPVAPHCKGLPLALWKDCPEHANCDAGVVQACATPHLEIVNEKECVLTGTARETIAELESMLIEFSRDLLCSNGKNLPFVRYHHVWGRPLFDFTAVAEVLGRPNTDRMLVELADWRTFLVDEQNDQLLIGLYTVPVPLPRFCSFKNSMGDTFAYLSTVVIITLLVFFLLGVQRYRKEQQTKRLILAVANLKKRACLELQKRATAVFADSLILDILDEDYPVDLDRRDYVKNTLWLHVLHDLKSDSRIERSWQNEKLVIKWVSGQQRMHVEQ